LSRKLIVSIPAGVAALILVAGAFYALLHPVTYQSVAKLALDPTGSEQSKLNLVNTFTNAGTAGTYVQLIADSPLPPSSPPVHLHVGALPDSRAIEVRTTSAKRSLVRPALLSVLSSTGRRDLEPDDGWHLTQIQSPSMAERVKVETRSIMLIASLLALVAAASAYLVVRSVAVRRRRPSASSALAGPGLARDGL
jgi:hypothetical protein